VGNINPLRWLRQAADFLSGHWSRDFGVFLFFLAVSAGFWLLQTLDETYEREMTVPLCLTDVPHDVVIISPLPAQLKVTVRDKGTTLARYWRHRSDTLFLSYRDYAGNRTQGRAIIPRTDVVEALQQRLHGSTKIQTMSPDTLEFYYNHGLHATIPVVVEGKVDTDSHYYLLNLSTNPSEVQVYATADVLDTLSYIATRPVNLTNLKENTTIDVALAPIRGTKIEPQNVSLTATVDVYMEQSIEVPVISLNFPGDLQLRTFPSSVKVVYTVGYTCSREITRDKFVCLVTYEEILDLQKRGINKIPVKLKSIPDGVSNVRIEPQQVDYLLESVAEDE